MLGDPLALALTAFAHDAAAALSREAADGAEIPFEIVEEPGARGTVPLYCYRPLTGAFVRARLGRLSGLASYAPAARALERHAGGLGAYLRRAGSEPVPDGGRDRADDALACFLDALFEGQSEFLVSEQRLARALRALETSLHEGRSVHTVVAPVLGLDLQAQRIELPDGLALVPGHGLDDVPTDGVWAWWEARDRTAIAVLTLETEPDDGPPLAIARTRLRRLLTTLRLYTAGSFALGPAAWTRVDDGPWQLRPLAGTGRAHGQRATVEAQAAEELRAFAALIARRVPQRGELAWALARYEMACERVSPFEALTDHLLALRALLEPEGPASGRLAQRLAAICALPEERAALAERTAHAVSLERAVVAGLAPPQENVDRLVSQLAGHLRALLRDVLCGHLDSDLCTVADGILADAVAASA